MRVMFTVFTFLVPICYINIILLFFNHYPITFNVDIINIGSNINIGTHIDILIYYIGTSLAFSLKFKLCRRKEFKKKYACF